MIPQIIGSEHPNELAWKHVNYKDHSEYLDNERLDRDGLEAFHVPR